MKIFCLEGEWSSRMTKPEWSVEPMLQTLEAVERTRYWHRRVGTEAELVRQANRWPKFKGDVLYIAAHGDGGTLDLGEDEPEWISVKDLGTPFEGKCASSWVVLSGCQTMLASDSDLEGFLDMTRADAVCGYRKSVDWVPSLALDMLLLRALHRRPASRRPRPVAFLTRFHRRYQSLIDETGFDWYVREGRGRDLVA